MSVANLMKNHITKISHKLGRSDSNDDEMVNIRMSKSLHAMQRDNSNSSIEVGEKISNKSSRIPSITSKKSKMSKSISLEESSTQKKSKLFPSKNFKSSKRPSIELVGGASTSGWYALNEETIPRRLPLTTLMPLNLGLKSLPTKLPPDDLPLPILKRSNDNTSSKSFNKTSNDETKIEKFSLDDKQIESSANDCAKNCEHDINKLNGDYFNINNRENDTTAQVTVKQVHFDITNSPEKSVPETLTPVLPKSIELEFIKLHKIQDSINKEKQISLINGKYY